MGDNVYSTKVATMLFSPRRYPLWFDTRLNQAYASVGAAAQDNMPHDFDANEFEEESPPL